MSGINLTKFLTSLLLLPLLAAFCLLAQGVLAKSNVSEWVLKQNSVDLGALNVFICDDAVKIECERRGYCVLAKAPDWKVYYYRPVEKKIWVSTLEAFNGLLLVNPFTTSTYGKGTFHDAGTIEYAGLQCKQIRPMSPKLWVMYTSNKITANEKVCEFLNRYYYVPNSKQVPLYKKIEQSENKHKLNNLWLTADMSADLRDKPRVTLETNSVRQITYRPGDFDVPQSFKRVQNVNDISLSNAHKEQINDLLDSLGFVNDNAAPAKAQH